MSPVWTRLTMCISAKGSACSLVHADDAIAAASAAIGVAPAATVPAQLQQLYPSIMPGPDGLMGQV